MSDERQQFSARLAEAMRAAGHEPRPAVLFRLFNARYAGRSVSFQTASRWLGGRSIPEQDKLQVLAGALGIAPQTLRYGDGPGKRLKEERAGWVSVSDPGDQKTLTAFLSLPPRHRKLVAELVRALSEA